tara:strand:+ start:402 stop:518 length:117 start_codon:yes stop_codon:yes gene_type:complete
MDKKNGLIRLDDNRYMLIMDDDEDEEEEVNKTDLNSNE